METESFKSIFEKFRNHVIRKQDSVISYLHMISGRTVKVAYTVTDNGNDMIVRFKHGKVECVYLESCRSGCSTGILMWNDTLIDVFHPAIIDREVYEFFKNAVKYLDI